MRRTLAVALAALGTVALAPLAQAAPGGVPGRPAGARVAADPPLTIDAEAARREAVDCVDFADAPADADAVVLVHGTFTEGHEQYAWNHELRLIEERLPHCVLTYPHRGQGDMQLSAEYVVVAVQEAARISRTGSVDLVGHSQGALMPRWAVKHWPSVQARSTTSCSWPGRTTAPGPPTGSPPRCPDQPSTGSSAPTRRSWRP